MKQREWIVLLTYRLAVNILFILACFQGAFWLVQQTHRSGVLAQFDKDSAVQEIFKPMNSLSVAKALDCTNYLQGDCRIAASRHVLYSIHSSIINCYSKLYILRSSNPIHSIISPKSSGILASKWFFVVGCAQERHATRSRLTCGGALFFLGHSLGSSEPIFPIQVKTGGIVLAVGRYGAADILKQLVEYLARTMFIVVLNNIIRSSLIWSTGW